MRGRPAIFDQPFGSRDKVIKCHLAPVPFRRLVPTIAKLRATTNIGQRKDAPLLDEEGDEDTELRSYRDPVSAIGSHDGGVCARLQSFRSANEEHGNLRAISRREANLDMTKSTRVEGHLPFRKQPHFGLARTMTANLNRLGERLLLDEHFVEAYGV